MNARRYCRCGAKLARDNLGKLCSACQRTLQRDTPPLASAAFWEHEHMRTAFESSDPTEVLRAYRTHPHHGHTLPQELVAGWLHIDQSTLSRIELGRRRLAFDEVLEFARTLGIPVALRFGLDGDPSHGSAREDPPREAAGSRSGPDEPHDDVAGPVGHHLLETLLALDARRASASRSMPSDGLSLPARADHLLNVVLQLDDQLGGRDLFEPMSRYVTALAPKVTDRGAELVAFGQLAQMAGWLALDGNRHAAAQRHFTTALYAANQADAPALAGSALAYMSLQATYGGQHRRALALAKTASTSASGGLTRLTRTTLATRLARAHASLGNRRECMRALDVMRTAFEATDHADEPPWVSYVDATEVAAQEGACYLELGMTTEARDALTRALNLLRAHTPHRARDQAHYLSRLARTQLLDGEVEEACATASKAVDLGAMLGSPRVAQRFSEFHDALNGNDAAAARQFRDRFAVVRRAPS